MFMHTKSADFVGSVEAKNEVIVPEVQIVIELSFLFRFNGFRKVNGNIIFFIQN